MKEKTKILIAGIGGVGGYFGGLLAKKYADDPGVDILFLARGEHLQQIRKNGLKVIKGAEEFIAKPALVTDNISETGIVDLIVVCTKSYHLEATMLQLKPCIGKNTLILPLLNGVDASSKIRQLLPDTTVLQGCVYIVSRLQRPGIIENTGNIQSLYFGADRSSDAELQQRLKMYETIFQQAGIEATLSNDISTVTWEKFIFLSPLATTTSYYDMPVGKVLAEHEDTVLQLIGEITEIAKVKGMVTDKDIISKTLHKVKSLPYENTSSMHNDYKNNKAYTELDSLTGYIVQAGREFQVDTPTYDTMYQYLKNKNKD